MAWRTGTVNHQLWYLDRLLQVHHLWLFCLPPSLFMVLCFAISSFVVFASIQSWSWRAWSWAGTLDSLMWPISKAWQRKGYIRGNMSQSNKSIHQSQWEPSNQTGLHIKKSLAILGWCCWYVPGTWSVISSIIPIISTSAAPPAATTRIFSRVLQHSSRLTQLSDWSDYWRNTSDWTTAAVSVSTFWQRPTRIVVRKWTWFTANWFRKYPNCIKCSE